MVAYHFAFDLRFYRVIAADFEHDPFWLGFRALIVTSFLALVGVSLVLADRAGTPPLHFWKRVGVIAACAVAASVGSWIVFPRTFITFGILHCIAVASILALARSCVGPRSRFAIGAALIAAGLALSHPFFDARAWSWLGFTERTSPRPRTTYRSSPVGGRRVRRRSRSGTRSRVHCVPPARAARRRAALAYTFLGRHGLVVYMVHQPILLGTAVGLRRRALSEPRLREPWQSAIITHLQARSWGYLVRAPP